jgi:hypothetical protein
MPNSKTIAGLIGPTLVAMWLALVGGLIRMLFPIQLAEVATKVSQEAGLIAAEAVVLLLVGAFLTYKAYSRRHAVNV